MSRKPLVSFHVGDPHSSSLSSEGRSPLPQLSWLPLPHLPAPRGSLPVSFAISFP